MNNDSFPTPIVPDGTGGVPARAKFRLICASKCKRFALEVSKTSPSPTRAKMFTRVSEDFLIACEAELKRFIHNRVTTHPSRGKTLM